MCVATRWVRTQSVDIRSCLSANLLVVTNIETFSDTTRDLLSQVLPRLEDISKLNQILFCKAVVARAIFDVLEFRAKLPGHLAHLAPMMDKLYQENMGKPKNGGFDCMRPYSTRYNVWRRDTFRLLGTLSEESQDFYFSDVASKYTNKIDGIIRELFSLEEDKARWDRIHKMIRATVDLAFLLKTQQTQFTFYLPDFREQGQVRFNGEYMREQNGANPEEVEGEPIKLVTWPAVFCYYFHLGEMVSFYGTAYFDDDLMFSRLKQGGLSGLWKRFALIHNRAARGAAVS